MIMSRFRRRVTGSSSAEPAKKSTDDTQAEAGSRRRHAVFYDVENTSSPDAVDRVVSTLEMNRATCDTQLVAVGNWRVIGQQTARLLARQGAELVHSAPSVGVRDWSDLRIAVDAGIWLGSAKPGDMLDIVSDDQAFDAVGDVAATLGVQFRRIPAREKMRPRDHPPKERGQSSERDQPSAENTRAASQEDILRLVTKLTASDSSGQGTTLDMLSNALKDSGFGRPPGSLRLITRLKRIKELRLDTDGHIRFSSQEDTPQVAEVDAEAESPAEPRRRTRRGRRGGRRRGGRRGNGQGESMTGEETPS